MFAPDLYPMHTKGGLWLPSEKPIYSPHQYVDDERCVLCVLFNEAGGNIAHDISIRRNPGVLTGGPAWTGGNFNGSALDFDGVNDLVNMGDAPTLDMGTRNFTISVWANADNQDRRDGLVGKIVTGVSGNGYSIGKSRLSSGKVGWRMNFGGTAVLADSDEVPIPGIADWAHWVFVVDRSNTAKLYFNGVVRAGLEADISTHSAVNIDNVADFRIGDSPTPDTTAFENWDGIIDNVRVYDDVALTPSEVAGLFHNPFGDIKELRPMVFGFTAAAPAGSPSPRAGLLGPLYGPLAGPIG